MADPASYRPATGDIPTAPGVYRFSDEHGRIIYVGKAKNLRNRLSTYFAKPETLTHKTRTMVFTATTVNWVVVNTELEALQLEYSWIKEFKPRFNIVFRDDKSYPYLAVSMNEEFPRVQLTRGKKRKGVRYFGPYSQPRALRETMDSLLRAFPIRSCSSGVFARAKASGKPCLLGYIGKCSAPCVGRVSPEQHRELAQNFVRFMETNAKEHIAELENRMSAAVAKLEYERAGLIRDELVAVRKIFEGPNIATIMSEDTNADFFAASMDDLEVAIQVFYVRQGRIRGQRAWVSERKDDSELSEILENIVMQVYAGSEPIDNGFPPVVYLPVELPDAAGLEAVLSAERGAKVHLKIPRRGEKAALMRIVADNAKQALALHKSRRAADLSTRSLALEQLQEALDTDQALLRIECYDISHTQGTNVVASMVVMEDGLLKKSEYRRFSISEDGSRDDTASMHEVLTRRFTAYLKAQKAPLGTETKFSYPPNLVIVDGGQPQVNAAVAALTELGLHEIAVVGLAKRLEELWLAGDDYPVILPRSSEGLFLIQRLRDEAHRFAISFHRQQRAKSMTGSVLDAVPGLGPNKRKALLKHFGSVKKTRAASIEELQEAPGIGPALAESIYQHLHEYQDAEPVPGVNMSTGEILS